MIIHKFHQLEIPMKVLFSELAPKLIFVLHFHYILQHNTLVENLPPIFRKITQYSG